MADAVHYLVEIQLSFVAPYISMGRLYTTGSCKHGLHLRYAWVRKTSKNHENLSYHDRALAMYYMSDSDCVV